MTETKPFPFESLPRLSRQDIKIQEGLNRFLPRRKWDWKTLKSLSQVIGKELGVSFRFQMEKVAVVDSRKALDIFPPRGVFAVLGLAPHTEKAILEIDTLLAHLMVDKLLGGREDPMTMIRSPTEIEQAVLSFLILKALAAIFDLSGDQARVHFRLEKLVTDVDFLPKPSGVATGDRSLLATFHLEMGERAGYARLLLPGIFFKEKAVPELSGDRAFKLGFLETEVRFELGRTTLMPEQVRALEPGDVMLLEETKARAEGDSLQGSLTLRFGSGETSFVQGKIIPNRKGLKVSLEGLS